MPAHLGRRKFGCHFGLACTAARSWMQQSGLAAASRPKCQLRFHHAPKLLVLGSEGL
jgi:hypothetical protein